MQTFRNLRELKNGLLASPELMEKFTDDPKGFVEEYLRPIDIPYIFILVIAIVGLALFTALIFGGIIALEEPLQVKDPNGTPMLISRDIPDFIIMIGSTALGALAGLLVPNDK